MMMSPDGRSMRRGRRQATRHRAERAAEVWCVGDEENPAVAVCTNISTDGVGLQTHTKFDVGDEVVVDIRRGKEIRAETFIYLTGTVVRVVALAGGRYMLGIHITKLERKGT